MLTLALLPKTEAVILPNMPKGKNKDEFGLCYLKAVENAGKRDIKVDNYVACTVSKNSLKFKDLGLDESEYDGIKRHTGNVGIEYASYLTDLSYGNKGKATDALLDMEQADLLQEFIEESRAIAVENNIWLFTILENLVKTAYEKRSTKKKELLKIVDELGVQALIADVISSGLYPVLVEMHSGLELGALEVETETIELETFAI